MSGLETKNYFTHNVSNAPLKTLLATGGADVQLRHLELGSHTALLCSRCWSSREVGVCCASPEESDSCVYFKSVMFSDQESVLVE